MKRALVLALALTSTLTACSGDNGNDAVGQATPTAGSSSCPSGPATTDLTKKPAAVLPEGSTAPADTAFTDVVVGKGAEAKEGSAVTVKYLGVLFDTCVEFDSSWSRGVGETLPFTIGSGVIPGFSKGATGMRVGGRRQVVIPSQDGYGARGSGQIPPNATLIFVIDLVTVS